MEVFDQSAAFAKPRKIGLKVLTVVGSKAYIAPIRRAVRFTARLRAYEAPHFHSEKAPTVVGAFGFDGFPAYREAEPPWFRAV
jgi:hypothetical protein